MHLLSRRSARAKIFAATLTMVLAVITIDAMAASAVTRGTVVGPRGVPWNVALDCGTTEPFADITISTDGVFFRELDGPWAKVPAQPSTPKSDALRAWTVYLRDGRIGRFVLATGPGSDGVSDRVYAYRLSVEFAGVPPVSGACDRLPDGARPSLVVNVPATEVLAIRAKPTVTAPVTASVGPGGIVWRVAAKDKGPWVPVADTDGESGPTTIVTGWVNAANLGRLR
jgi:uncharacterized membrane protein